MNLPGNNLFHCVILRSQPVSSMTGVVVSWGARSISIAVKRQANLTLDELVVVELTFPDTTVRLYSRVVSIVWQQAEDILGLAVRAVKRPGSASTEPQLETPDFTKRVS